MRIPSLAALAACAGLCAAAFAAEGGIEGKLRFEKEQESKLEGLLERVLGPGRAKVFIDASLDLSVTEETVGKAPDKEEAGAEVLPGFRQPRAAKRVSFARSPVRRLGITVVVDPSVDERRIQAIVDTATEVLGLDPGRGDTLRVAKAPLRGTLSKTLARPEVSSGIVLLCAAALIGLAALAVSLPLLRRTLWRLPREASPLVNAVEILEGAEGLPARALLGPARPLDLPFVRPGDIKAVARFLSGQTPQAARWVLASLEEDLAAALFRLLAPGARAGAASAMLEDARPGSRERARLEAALRAFLEKESSGSALLETLLTRSPEHTRHQVLDHLRAESPAAAGRLQTGLVGFEDLGRADNESLLTLASELATDELALALQDASPSLVDRFLAVLPGVFRDGVNQRLKFHAPRSTDDVAKARAGAVARWKELEAMGRVSPL